MPISRRPAVSLLVAVALLVMASSVSAQDVRNGLTVDMVRTFSLKQIRFELKRRHILCDGCMEKEHFLNKLLDSLDAPVDKTILTMEDAGSPNFQKSKKPSPKKSSDKDGEEAASVPEGGAGSSDKPKPADVDMEGLYESIMKKKKENDKLKETLRKAGIDPSHVGTGPGGSDGFGGEAFEKWAKQYEKKRGGKGGQKAEKKKAPPPTPVDDDGGISDEM